MPSRGQPLTLTYTAQSTSTGFGVTGDSANHTIRWIRDGVTAAPQNAPAEVDATNAPGEYNLTLTADECLCLFGKLAGKSSTANTRIIPLAVTFEVLPATLHNGMAAASVDGVAGLASAVDALLAAMNDYLAGGFKVLETADGALRPQSLAPGTAAALAAAVPGAVAWSATGNSFSSTDR